MEQLAGPSCFMTGPGLSFFQPIQVFFLVKAEAGISNGVQAQGIGGQAQKQLVYTTPSRAQGEAVKQVHLLLHELRREEQIVYLPY